MPGHGAVGHGGPLALRRFHQAVLFQQLQRAAHGLFRGGELFAQVSAGRQPGPAGQQAAFYFVFKDLIDLFVL